MLSAFSVTGTLDRRPGLYEKDRPDPYVQLVELLRTGATFSNTVAFF